MQHSICSSRMVVDIWPGGWRANDAALHFAASWASLSAGAGGSCTACAGATTHAVTAQTAKQNAILRSGPESVTLAAG